MDEYVYFACRGISYIEDPLKVWTSFWTQYKAVMFGSVSSPFLLAAVLQKLIKDDCENIIVREALERSIYHIPKKCSDDTHIPFPGPSRVVLCWLAKYNIKEIYVHNRVKQIRDLCAREDVKIYHVPTNMNPADIITKEQKAEDFENWPEQEVVYNLYPEGTETLSDALFCMTTSILATAAIDAMDQAKQAAIRIMQADMFGEVLHQLKRGNQIKKGPYRKLNLFLDAQGIIRCMESFISLTVTVNKKGHMQSVGSTTVDLIRAVHLEIAPDSSGEAFLRVLQSLSWKMGTPKHLNVCFSVKGVLSASSLFYSKLNYFGLKTMTHLLLPQWCQKMTYRCDMVRTISNDISESEVNRPIPVFLIIKKKMQTVGENCDVLNVLDPSQILEEALTVRNELPRLFTETAKRCTIFWQKFQQQYLEHITIRDLVIIHSHDPRLQWRKAIVIDPIISEDEVKGCKYSITNSQDLQGSKEDPNFENSKIDRSKNLQFVIECTLLILIQDNFSWLRNPRVGDTFLEKMVTCVTQNLQPPKAMYYRGALKETTTVSRQIYTAVFLRFLMGHYGYTSSSGNTVRCRSPWVMVTTTLADRLPPDLHLFRNYESPLSVLGVQECLSNYMILKPPNEQKIWEAARCSGAAPSYFSACGQFLDGGLVSNNPVLDTLTEIGEWNMAVKKAGREDEVFTPTVVVSLGCGKPPVTLVDNVDLAFPSMLELRKGIQAMYNMFNLLVEQACASEGRIVDRARIWCSDIHVPFFRLTPQFSEDVQLDEAQDECLVRCMWETKAYMTSQRTELEHLKTLLQPQGLATPPAPINLLPAPTPPPRRTHSPSNRSTPTHSNATTPSRSPSKLSLTSESSNGHGETSPTFLENPDDPAVFSGASNNSSIHTAPEDSDKVCKSNHDIMNTSI
ncbi:unnamed protein product, partial [Meganyctiphanes norvegica]